MVTFTHLQIYTPTKNKAKDVEDGLSLLVLGRISPQCTNDSLEISRFVIFTKANPTALELSVMLELQEMMLSMGPAPSMVMSSKCEKDVL
jgi:hypothetical protein